MSMEKMSPTKTVFCGGESGYSSDSSTEDLSLGNYYPWCKKDISGPRIGFVVHLGVKHTDQRVIHLSTRLTASEMHKLTSVRYRQLQRATM